MVAGCATHPDPLAGWDVNYGGKLDNAIVEDYEAFVQQLPPKERKLVHEYNILQYKNGTDEHAVRIEIGINGTFWDYVLIYDNENKRIKTKKYARGEYSLW